MREQEQRQVYYDRDLGIEAYRLSGIVQKFPNHFHEYYVIGFIEGGRRRLWCRDGEFDLTAGDLILFHPRDNHQCAPLSGELLDYRAVNIRPEVMQKAVREITGREAPLSFRCNVARQSEAAGPLSDLFDAIVQGRPRLEKEEALFFLLRQVMEEHAAPFEEADLPQANPQIQALCAYMEKHYSENLSLDDLLSMVSFGKSYLLRSFTRQLGVSPYRYLQTVRVGKAKERLEQGVAPIDVAGLAGFSDQSHFSNLFKEFIGLTPKQYQRIFTAEPNKGADR